jgi:hypothetical protein
VFSVGSVQRPYNELLSRVSQLAESCSRWGWGQFGNTEEGIRPPLETATKQWIEDRDYEH